MSIISLLCQYVFPTVNYKCDISVRGGQILCAVSDLIFLEKKLQVSRLISGAPNLYFFMLLNLISFCDFVAVVIAVNFKLIVFIYLFSLISVRHLHIFFSLLDASLFLTFFFSKS